MSFFAPRASATLAFAAALLILIAGCSGGGSSGGSGRAAPASPPGGSPGGGSTSGGTSTGGGSGSGGGATAGSPSAPGASLGGPPPGAVVPPAPGAVEAALNAELADVWDALRPGLQVRFLDELRTNLVGRHGSSTVEIEVIDVSRVRFDIVAPPGFLAFTPDRVELRLPLTGTWSIEIDAEVVIRGSLLGWTPSLRLPLTLRVDDLSLADAVDMDLTDPERPAIRQVATPQVTSRISLASSNTLASVILQLLSPTLDREAQRLLATALGTLTPSLSSLGGFPGPGIPGDGAAPLADSGAATPFEEVALNVGRKMVSDHMPFGQVMNAEIDAAAGDSWVDAYRNGGPGLQGNVVRHHGGGDSAIWTGHFLAAAAFRYAVTGDPEALDHVRHALAGIGHQLDVNGATGLLAREAAPEASVHGQQLVAQGKVFRRGQINGQTWVGSQGGYGVSRDQNLGVFFGLILAHDLVPDPAVRAEAARRIQMILDYLIAHDWLIDEDRPSFDGRTRGGFPTYWLASVQKLAFLHMGERVAPGRYGAEIAQTSPTVGGLWFGAWTSAMGLDHYYKFNLTNVTHFNYFRLETDPWRWQEALRAFRIVRRYVGHHRNAHFDLIWTSIEPGARADFFPSARESLRRFLDRNHRQVAPPVVDLSNVTYVAVPQVGYASPGTGTSLTSNVQQLPSEPLDFHQRDYTGHFHWQRDPFTPATPNAGNPFTEKSGLDVVLPYWMGRFLGAF